MIETKGLLGQKLDEAEAALEAEGINVHKTEVSSRKGLAGDSARVIRARNLEDGSVELCYSIFKTDVRYTEK